MFTPQIVGGEGPPADENYMICYLQVEEIEKFVNHYVLEGAGSIDKNGKTTFFSISCFY